MQGESGWEPVAPSHFLRAGENIVAGFMAGEEVALWRSAAGAAQAWENRCPHRGTRLTLGRLLGGRLSCAYHGWEFAADGGRCTAIPAHPSMAAPKNLCVRTFAVRESPGMVWVRKPPAEDGGADVPALQPPARFCRSLGIAADAARVSEELRTLQFAPVAPRSWAGLLAAWRCTVFVNAAGPALTFAHAWLADPADEAVIHAVQAALVRLRARAEERGAA